MKIVFADVEANGLKPTKIHFIRVKTVDHTTIKTFFDMTEFVKFVEFYKPDKWVFHNGLGYDCWVINRLVKRGLVNPLSIIDTQVVSKLVDYTKFNTHSLAEIGSHLGILKGEYTGSWDECNPEMIAYGEQDVEVLEAIFNYYKKYIYSKEWSKAMRVEHDMAIICYDMSQNGFEFDVAKAKEALDEITSEMDSIEKSFKESFPPKLTEINRIQYRTKKDGSLYSNVEKAFSLYPLCKVDGGELICYDYEEFNPGSPKQRIDLLWEAGWKPVEMTDGYKKLLRGKRSGW